MWLPFHPYHVITVYPVPIALCTLSILMTSLCMHTHAHTLHHIKPGARIELSIIDTLKLMIYILRIQRMFKSHTTAQAPCPAMGGK